VGRLALHHDTFQSVDLLAEVNTPEVITHLPFGIVILIPPDTVFFFTFFNEKGGKHISVGS